MGGGEGVRRWAGDYCTCTRPQRKSPAFAGLSYRDGGWNRKARSVHAFPGGRPAEHQLAAGDLHLLAAFDKLDALDLEAVAGGGLEALAAAPAAVDLLHVPEHHHAGDGLALLVAAAFVAGGVGLVEALDDLGRDRAVLRLVDLGEGHGLFGFVVEGLPLADV